MRPLALLVAASCFLQLRAQELLPNGGFEQYTACPDSLGQLDRAIGWSSPTGGSTDYFNACDEGVPPGPFIWNNVGVPDNTLGHQPAHGGSGYAGIVCSDTVATVPNGNYKEYASHALAAPLLPGEAYSVEFFVNLADRSSFTASGIGALLSVGMPHREDTGPIASTPQITADPPALLNDSVGWMRVRSCFIADSAYAFITIGNFPAGMQEAHGPTAFPPAEWYSYYYVDDVSVRHLARPWLGPDITICQPTPIAVQNPLPGMDYRWSTGEAGTGITVDAAGTYSVRFGNDQCPLADTIMVTMGTPVTFGLPADTAVDFCIAAQVPLAARPQPPDAQLTWSTGDTTASILVGAAGTYRIQGNAEGYCAASASITVTNSCNSPVYAPNAFTPDGDGINDLWRPVWSANPDAVLQWTVFDRWGHALRNGSGPDDAWDGTARGEAVPAGTYAWRVRAFDPATGMTHVLQGHLTLVR